MQHLAQQSSQPTNSASTSSMPSSANDAMNCARNFANMLWSCMICRDTGTHPLHPSKCPFTQELIVLGLITFNLDSNRYVLPNRKDLPRVLYGWKGGLNSFLRQMAPNGSNPESKGKGRETTNANQTRDIPPHMASSASTGWDLNNLSLSLGDEFVINGTTFAVSALGSERTFELALHSGKDTARFNPLGDRSAKTKPQESTSRLLGNGALKPPSNSTQPSPTLTTDQKGSPLSQAPAKMNIPQLTNLINRSDGWKASLPSQKKTKNDVPMKDRTKTNPGAVTSIPSIRIHFYKS
ncbi:hypothetical protein VKT23_013813 [Stygiomarasmius scandens]|uniref:DUF4100 domain-containing protein n=1 Tax=Marasmiellus scandens TaxID=2682957 RepID=A0ABR1J2A3_9AGAR